MKSSLLSALLLLTLAALGGCRDETSNPPNTTPVCTGNTFVDAKVNGNSCLSTVMCQGSDATGLVDRAGDTLVLAYYNYDALNSLCEDYIILVLIDPVAGGGVTTGTARGVNGGVQLGSAFYSQPESGATATIDEVRADGSIRGRFSIRLTDTASGRTIALTDGSFDTK